MRISPNHPLRRLFADLVAKELPADHDVGEMLVESNPLLDAPSFEREREVRKHIGDYTLFLTGMFPEYVATLPRRGLRLDSIIDYVKAGKESYRIVAAFDQFEYRHVAPLFRRLLWVGCCGWAAARARYFTQFRTIELQSTFYQPSAVDLAEEWRRDAPEDFRFCLKACARRRPASDDVRPGQPANRPRSGL